MNRTVSEEEKRFLPEVCPCCGARLTWNGVNLECNNSQCSGSDSADLYQWIWTIAPVHGLGGSILNHFLCQTQIENIEDLYPRNLIMDGTSATAMKLAEMWDKLQNKPVTFDTALVALNIPRLGWKSAQKIAEDKDLSQKILDSCEEGLTTEVMLKLSAAVGQATLDSIMSNLDKLARLRFIKNRIVMKSEEIKSDPVQIKGEVVITGKLETCKRSEFEKIIVNAGYSLAPAVKSGVLYLITNTPDSGSSKNKKADELKIQKITENEFLEMIGYEK